MGTLGEEPQCSSGAHTLHAENLNLHPWHLQEGLGTNTWEEDAYKKQPGVKVQKWPSQVLKELSSVF